MITQERLKELFNLDPETGILYWKKKPGKRICVGDIAGYLGQDGYWRIGLKRKLYLRSRLVFLFCTGSFPIEVDHRNRVTGDDRPSNLRASTHSENSMNRESGSKTKKSGLPKGVWVSTDHPRENPFNADIGVRGKKIRLGPFPTAELAHEAYKSAARKLYGEFACFGKDIAP